MGSKVRRLLGHKAGPARRSTGQRRRIEAQPAPAQAVRQYQSPRPESCAVERKADYPHPQAKVWRALTDASKLAQWLHPVSDHIVPVRGTRFAFFPADGDAERIDCRIIDAEPGRRLSYTWKPANEEPESMVTWTLEPIDGGTRVRLQHDGVVPARAVPLLAASLAGSTPTRRRSIRQRRVSRQQFREVLQWR